MTPCVSLSSGLLIHHPHISPNSCDFQLVHRSGVRYRLLDWMASGRVLDEILVAEWTAVDTEPQYFIHRTAMELIINPQHFLKPENHVHNTCASTLARRCSLLFLISSWELAGQLGAASWGTWTPFASSKGFCAVVRSLCVWTGPIY